MIDLLVNGCAELNGTNARIMVMYHIIENISNAEVPLTVGKKTGVPLLLCEKIVYLFLFRMIPPMWALATCISLTEL